MSKNRLLVIDDEFGPRESLRFLFKDLYDVVCVDSVDGGIAELREHAPDCIITDIKMPGKNGIQGLKEIRAIDPSVSIIMLTGFGSLDTAQEAIRHGASDYVKKPFDTDAMRATVQSHINKTRMLRGQQSAYDNLQQINAHLQSELSSKAHLAQLGQASTEFVHDLRSPLTVICGYVSLMMSSIKEGTKLESDSLDTEKTREYLEQMEKSVNRCQEMSQMWRSLSQNGGGADFKACSLDAIIREACDTLTPIAAKGNAEIDLEMRDTPLMMEGDNLQLYRAMQNLASNAIQALPTDGSGRLCVRVKRDASHACVEFLDNGCGIPADKIESVFTPYVSTKQAQGGMGIGLFITKKIIENHNGSICLANRPEGGVAAVVKLPLAGTPPQ